MGVVAQLGVVQEPAIESSLIEPLSPTYTCHQQSSTTYLSDDTLIELVQEIPLQSKKRRSLGLCRSTNKWSRAEVDMFLKLINLYGTDFSMIALRMHKSRDQIKRKYTMLQRTHGQALQDIFDGLIERDAQLQTFYNKLAREV